MSVSREELQDAARRAFSEGGALPPDAERSWELVTEMGWLMMAVPEELGGLGLGVEAAGVVHTELGRALVPGPAIAQMLTIEALASAGEVEGCGELLGRAMAGEVMTASLVNPASGSETQTLRLVPDADRASHVLVVEEARVSLLPLDRATITSRETWDKTRRLFDVAPNGQRLLLAEGAQATALAERLQAQLAFALAGDSLGAADALLGLTIDYLKTRRQFDRPLALFQALKHRVADMKTWLAAAEALFWARAADSDADPVSMGALKAHATMAAQRIVEEAIQLHGGIGVTMEHYCHLYLKRVMLNCALGGDADYWEERAGREALAAF